MFFSPSSREAMQPNPTSRGNNAGPAVSEATLLDIGGSSSNVFNISSFDQLDGERSCVFATQQAAGSYIPFK